jgi:hypothetical protein
MIPGQFSEFELLPNIYNYGTERGAGGGGSGGGAGLA